MVLAQVHDPKLLRPRILAEISVLSPFSSFHFLGLRSILINKSDSFGFLFRVIIIFCGCIDQVFLVLHRARLSGILLGWYRIVLLFLYVLEIFELVF